MPVYPLLASLLMNLLVAAGQGVILFAWPNARTNTSSNNGERTIFQLMIYFTFVLIRCI